MKIQSKYRTAAYPLSFIVYIRIHHTTTQQLVIPHAAIACYYLYNYNILEQEVYPITLNVQLKIEILFGAYFGPSFFFT